MLKDSFYHINSLTQSDGILATLIFNTTHPIFEGHFPGQPVVPGACMLDMVREVLIEATGQNYRLKKASNLKFIAPIDPHFAEDVELKITHKPTDEVTQVSATLSVNGVICFKMQGTFSF